MFAIVYTNVAVTTTKIQQLFNNQNSTVVIIHESRTILLT